LQAVQWVESYVFRRAICAIPTNSMNKTFGAFGKSLKKDRYLESIRAGFLLLPSYRRFSSDAEFERDLKIKDLYNFRNRSYWLRRLENHDRKERVPVDEYTIEHILPQNDSLSAQWKMELGPEWERVQKTWLHTLGNLTLTGYNSELSDHSFIDKREMKGGFAESPLRMNDGLGKLGIPLAVLAVRCRDVRLRDPFRARYRNFLSVWWTIGAIPIKERLKVLRCRLSDEDFEYTPRCWDQILYWPRTMLFKVGKSSISFHFGTVSYVRSPT
jgi:hypothetical protein